MSPTAPGALAPLPVGTRLVHIGPSKTGTTSLQGAMWFARRAMLEQGVRYAGTTRHSAIAARAAAGIRAFYAEDGRPPAMYHWDGVVKEVRRAREDRVMFTSEYLAHAPEERVRRIVSDLGGDRVHVAVTLRPVPRMLASLWQQRVQSGTPRTFEEWLTTNLGRSGPVPDEGVWHQHRHDRLIARWAAVVGAERITAIVVDPTDHAWILRVFEQLLGLRDGTLKLEDDYVNRSLTAPEAQAVRLLSVRLREAGLGRADIMHIVHNGAARYLKLRTPPPDEPSTKVPAWAAARAGDLAGEIVAGIRATGVRVVGDLEALLALPSIAADDAPVDHRIPDDIAASMAMGVAYAGGMMRRSQVVAAHARLAESGELSYLSNRDLLRLQVARARRLGPRWLRTRLGLGA